MLIKIVQPIGWLQRGPEKFSGKGEAYCKLCRTPLRAHKTDLKKHATTNCHKLRASSLDVQTQPDLTSFGRLNYYSK